MVRVAHLDPETAARRRAALVAERAAHVAVVAEEEERARELAAHRDVDAR